MWFAVEYGLEFRHEPIYKPRWDVDAAAVRTLYLAQAEPTNDDVNGLLPPYRATAERVGRIANELARFLVAHA